jgi:GH25 family lysozyme M1 (1,4-beta-N-acetylmuramidase)
MQDISTFIRAWEPDKDKYGWDLRQVGQILLIAPDVSHWSVGYSLKIDEDKFAKQCEEKNVKAIIYKGTDSNRTTGELFRDHSAKFWWTLGGKLKLLRMCYHWLQYSVDPKKAFGFHKQLMDECPTELPYELDFEESSLTNVGDYIWRAEVWLGMAEEAMNDLPMLYTGGWYLQKLRALIPRTYMQKMGALHKYPLHIAHYNKKYPRKWCQDERLFYYYQPWDLDEWAIWQYTDKADFPHYNDGDNYNGTQWGIPSLGLDMNYIKLSWLQKYLKGDDGQEGSEDQQEENQEENQTENSIYYIAKFGMNIREGPGTQYKKKSEMIKPDTRLKLLDVGGNGAWIKTEYGWVCKSLNGKDFLEIEKP